MEQKVDQAIRSYGLCAPGDRIVVAVSGGPDSVALFRCLWALRARWNWKVCIGHVDHGFRGVESERDADFVEALAEKFGVPVTVCRLHLKKQDAKRKKQSLQEYARIARYEALEGMVRDWEATKLALGHTADDQAETVLMWMLRGSGTGGLGGIPPKRGARVVRPLLGIQRMEILSYLQARQEEFMMDSSNVQQVYLRNRIRQDLIPHLKQYSPGIVNILTRQAHVIRDDHTYLEKLAHEAGQRTCATVSEGERQFDRVALGGLPLPIRRRVIRQSLQQVCNLAQGPRFDIVERILDRLEHGQSGWTIACHGVLIYLEYDCLIIRRREEKKRPTVELPSVDVTSLPIPGEVLWPPTGHRMTANVTSMREITKPVSTSETYLDPSTFTPELAVRRWVPGDRFCPQGFGGREKKLQDFFSDIKLPRSQRINVPLLVAPEGIVWVGGLRADERFQASPLNTWVIVAKMVR